MINNTNPVKYVLILLCMLSVTNFSQVKLPKLISDGMVLQRDTEINIWGWAAEGEKISVSFLDSTYVTTTDNEGNWSIKLPKMNAGGTIDIKVNASNSITIGDIMIGDVWICSGQSNMELTMQRVSPLYEPGIAADEIPYIRYFEVSDKYNFNSGGLTASPFRTDNY